MGEKPQNCCFPLGSPYSAGGGPSHGHRQHAQKFGRDRVCGPEICSRANRHTQRETDVLSLLIIILCHCSRRQSTVITFILALFDAANTNPKNIDLSLHSFILRERFFHAVFCIQLWVFALIDIPAYNKIIYISANPSLRTKYTCKHNTHEQRNHFGMDVISQA